MIIVIGAFEIKGGFGTIVSDAIANKKIISADNWKLNGAAAAIPIIISKAPMTIIINAPPSKITP
jgi:SSS family solute:Na+ symporter